MKLLQLFEEATGTSKDNLQSYEQVMRDIEGGTRPKGFGNPEPTSILRQDTNYLITLRDFFEHAGDQDITPMRVEEVKYLDTVTSSDWEVIDSGYTYNFSGALERDVRYFLMENIGSDNMIAFFSVHIGLDARVGFSRYFAMSLDDSYALDIMLMGPYTVASGTIHYTDSNTELFMVDASPAGDEVNIYLQGTGDTIEGYLDLYDTEGLKADLMEVLADAFDADIETIEIVEY